LAEAERLDRRTTALRKQVAVSSSHVVGAVTDELINDTLVYAGCR